MCHGLIMHEWTVNKTIENTYTCNRYTSMYILSMIKVLRFSFVLSLQSRCPMHLVSFSHTAMS